MNLLGLLGERGAGHRIQYVMIARSKQCVTSVQKMNKVKCPKVIQRMYAKMVGPNQSQYVIGVDYADCIEDKCAMWSIANGRCGLRNDVDNE